MVYKTLERFPRGKRCSFCKTSFVDSEVLGGIYQTNDIIIHYFCLLLASEVEQKGTDKQGLLGFFSRDIKKEVKRGSAITCYYCNKKGATVICAKETCQISFHVPCGQSKGSLHQFFSEFKSFCWRHKPRQVIPHTLRRRTDLECILCYSHVQWSTSSDWMWPPCCRPSSLLHRRCIQKFATSSGYYFKCPFCNNNEDFHNGMKHYGIYIPEQEASWEREPNAFQELLERELKCEADPCLCLKGPVHFIKNHQKWHLEPCRLCGSQGMHRVCMGRKFSKAGTFECSICSEVYNRGASERSISPEEKEKFITISDSDEDSDESAPPRRGVIRKHSVSSDIESNKRRKGVSQFGEEIAHCSSGIIDVSEEEEDSLLKIERTVTFGWSQLPHVVELSRQAKELQEGNPGPSTSFQKEEQDDDQSTSTSEGLEHSSDEATSDATSSSPNGKDGARLIEALLEEFASSSECDHTDPIEPDPFVGPFVGKADREDENMSGDIQIQAVFSLEDNPDNEYSKLIEDFTQEVLSSPSSSSPLSSLVSNNTQPTPSTSVLKSKKKKIGRKPWCKPRKKLALNSSSSTLLVGVSTNPENMTSRTPSSKRRKREIGRKPWYKPRKKVALNSSRESANPEKRTVTTLRTDSICSEESSDGVSLAAVSVQPPSEPSHRRTSGRVVHFKHQNLRFTKVYNRPRKEVTDKESIRLPSVPVQDTSSCLQLIPSQSFSPENSKNITDNFDNSFQDSLAKEDKSENVLSSQTAREASRGTENVDDNSSKVVPIMHIDLDEEITCSSQLNEKERDPLDDIELREHMKAAIPNNLLYPLLSSAHKEAYHEDSKFVYGNEYNVIPNTYENIGDHPLSLFESGFRVPR